jgi:hypothetical protein
MSPYTLLAAPQYVDGDITTWLDQKIGWLSTTLPKLFLVILLAIGVYLLIVTRGMMRKVIVMGLAGAIAFMILMNADAIAKKFGTEVVTTSAAASTVAVAQQP